MESIKINNALWVMGLLLVSLCGCETLSDTNVNPNKLSEDQVDPALVMTRALSGAALEIANNTMTNNSVGDCFYSELMQYTQLDYLSYSITNQYNWSPQNFADYSRAENEDAMRAINNSVFLGRLAKNSKTDSLFLRGVSMVLSSFWFGYYTSAWGDVPYSEAMKGPEGIMRPAFDEQPQVFIGVLKELEEANDILKDLSVSANTRHADILYDGDPAKWRAFANSLRLRFLMRLSEKTTEMESLGVDVKAAFNQIVSHPDEFPLIKSTNDNAALSFPGTAIHDSWPYGPLRTPNRQDFYRQKAGAPIVKFLMERNDPRLTVWFSPVQVPTLVRDRGTDGLLVKDSDGKVRRYFKSYHADLDTNLYVGMNIAMPDPDSRNRKDQDQVNQIATLDPGIYVEAASNPFVSYLADMWGENSNPLVKSVFISAAEVNFILAEGVVRGWISGSAQEYYKNGIAASLTQYGIVDGDRKVYDKSSHGIVPFDLDHFLTEAIADFDNSSDKISPIIAQGWAASFGTSNIVAWFNWRRTGYPDLGKNVIAGPKGDKMPVRLAYGENSLKFNGDNLNRAVMNLEPAVNDQWSKMWLLQGTGKPW